MFSKPFRVKSNTQMKGSDKKKLKAEIKKKFPTAFSGSESGSNDPIDDIISPKDEITVSKIYTFTGESFFVYYQGKNPLFFEPEKDRGNLHPTVYTLWNLPQLLPALTTHPLVVEKLANGADLMLPGIVVNHKLGIKAYLGGKIKKGDILAVNLTSNKAPMAVGTAFHSSEDMYMSGNRGKGLVVLHCLGDQLWASGSKSQPPELGPPEGLDFLSNSSDEDEPCEDKDQALDDNSESEEENPSEGEAIDEVTDELEKQNLNFDNGKEDDPEDPTEVNVEEPQQDLLPQSADAPLTTEEVDQMLETAFFQACKTSAKKAELPILSSNFFRVHMVNACPPGKTLDLKKSSYKKLSKFLSKMQADGIITVTEPKKGVETIAKINFEHERLAQFRVIKYVDAPIATQETSDEKAYEPPVITELKMVSGDVSKFFKACGVPKGGLTATDVRTVVKEYIDKAGLQNKDDPKLVSLSDPLLANVVLVKGEENSVNSIAWEKVYTRIMSKMSQGYSMAFKGCPPTFHKGKLELIELTIGTRSGNKKVTLVHNLDVFGIDLSEFAHKCQVGVAASSAIHEAPNKKRAGGLPVMEVLIQGNQVAFVGKLLVEQYKIHKKYIKGLELAIKPKKGK